MSIPRARIRISTAASIGITSGYLPSRDRHSHATVVLPASAGVQTERILITPDPPARSFMDSLRFYLAMDIRDLWSRVRKYFGRV